MVMVRRNISVEILRIRNMILTAALQHQVPRGATPGTLGVPDLTALTGH
jgi:hypothetical protein